MTLPYRWRAHGTTYTRGAEHPAPGTLWPFEHAVYRVVSTQPIPDAKLTAEQRVRLEGWTAETRERRRPYLMCVRRLDVADAPVWKREHDRWITVNDPFGVEFYPDEHYPICGTCHEPLPCREKMAERISVESAKRMTRYENAGICPSCEEPVTVRQQSITFDENLEVIGGPPLTYHLRNRCHTSAMEYEKRWVADAPGDRRTTLSCVGHVTTHNDGTYECTELHLCPGPTAGHPGYSTCRCPDCWARGAFDCRPFRDSQLVDRRI